MNTYRAVSIYCFGFCIYGGFQLLRLLLGAFLAPNSHAPLVGNLVWILLCLATFVGAVASIFIFLSGALWARRFVGLLLCLYLSLGIVQLFQGFRPPFYGYIIEVLSLAAVVFLFWPRQESIA
ncbi:MAG TPA: hypothetical protein VL970_12170 [Candidatus Acidoferrales bacterium]|nr:hypothetical protein [Candidatus Acidoferrales bacterium]